MAAIEKLHQADIEATLTQDPASLTKLWSEGGANFGFPGPPVVGIRDMGSAYAKFRAEHPDFQVVKYAPVINEIQIVDEWAIEAGDFGGIFKMSAKDEPVTVRSKGMRVLKRQQDGSWKFAIVGLK
ncbi:MAG TPA: nuclear transport factor 2 family protein [Candidatus Acidoferrum sp.]|nr:nuclear transport factor 2 family protein [Candidatus Acidoferrum sp.]